MASATSRPESASSGTGHHAGGESNPERVRQLGEELLLEPVDELEERRRRPRRPGPRSAPRAPAAADSCGSGAARADPAAPAHLRERGLALLALRLVAQGDDAARDERREQRDPPQRAQRMRGSPDDRAGGTRRRAAAQTIAGRSLSTGANRPRTATALDGGPGEHRAEDHDDAVASRRPSRSAPRIDVPISQTRRAAVLRARLRSGRPPRSCRPARRTTSTASPTSTSAQPTLRSVSRRAPRARTIASA